MLKASVHPVKQRTLGSIRKGMEDEQDSSKCPGSENRHLSLFEEKHNTSQSWLQRGLLAIGISLMLQNEMCYLDQQNQLIS